MMLAQSLVIASAAVVGNDHSANGLASVRTEVLKVILKSLSNRLVGQMVEVFLAGHRRQLVCRRRRADRRHGFDRALSGDNAIDLATDFVSFGLTVLEHMQGEGRSTVTSHPSEDPGNPSQKGDGIIHDRETGRSVPTEHVMVASARDTEGVEIHQRILDAIQSKVSRGSAYGAGKTLVVLSEATGEWFPNRVARALPQPLHFSDVWVIALQPPTPPYTYGVAWLDLSSGNAPTWSVSLNDDFTDWTVTQRQQSRVSEEGRIRRRIRTGTC
jgi:hypothetical protein